MKPGTIFFGERFPDIEKSVLRVILHRLVTEDFIERVAHGIYRKPKYSEFLEVRLFADADEVARAVAKKEKFKIDYHPAYALNALGFSQQVPLNPVYVIDSFPRKIYLHNGAVIKMKQTSSKNLAYKNKLLQMLVHSLRVLGKGNVKREGILTIQHILKLIPEDEFVENLHLAPEWIQQLLMDLYAPQPTF